MRTLAILLLLVAGCATTTQLPDLSGTAPVLIYQVPLPSFYQTSYSGEVKVELKLLIARDSSVQDVMFLSSNTDPKWEDRAIEEIRKWRFLPATQNGRPVPVWIRQVIIIRPEESLKMFLSEIAYTDRSGADSIYNLLMTGEDFGSLARTVSTAPSREQNGKLGEVDIRTFPFNIQKEMEKLSIGEITKPLEFGHSFVIFKRLHSEEELQGK